MVKNKFVKKAAALILLFILIMALASCETKNNTNSNQSTNDTKPPERIGNENAVWGEGIRTYIVVKDGEESELYDIAYEMSYDIYYYTDNIAFNMTDIIEDGGHEVVIGETNRAISSVAYEELYKYLDYKNEDGFLIYAEGNSIALAYSSEIALNDAIKYMKDNYYSKNELVFSEDGVVGEGKYNLAEVADNAREEVQIAALDEIEKQLSKDIREEIEKILSLYTPEAYEWIADLYDSEIGGFYFSNSARDNDGYLPDIESTYQALWLLESTGMFSDVGGYKNAISEETKTKILTFAKSLQSSEDGYFYHPQWGYKNEIVREDYRDARRGRDLAWATRVITNLGGTPFYDTPNGIKGELGEPGVSKTALTARLSASSVLSVSKVVFANSVLPPQLQSMDAWRTYIDNLNVLNDPYMAGNTLAAQYGEVQAAGEEYINYLTDYLTSIQNKETGFWGEGVNVTTMNGFMKISHSYSYYGRIIPNVDKALDSTMTLLLDLPNQLEKDPGLHICTPFNTWSNFTQILDSAKKDGGAEYTNTLREKIVARAPELIKVTYEILLQYKRPDEGGFSYFTTKPCNYSQKAPVACATSAESDMNASTMGISEISGRIFAALGVKKVPIFVPEDADVFLRLIECK